MEHARRRRTEGLARAFAATAHVGVKAARAADTQHHHGTVGESVTVGGAVVVDAVVGDDGASATDEARKKKPKRQKLDAVSGLAWGRLQVRVNDRVARLRARRPWNELSCAPVRAVELDIVT